MGDKLSAPLDEFKEREIEIINLMADGLTNQEIADSLFITKETVRWYNKQIYSKLGTSRRTEAIALAREMNLISERATETPAVQKTHHKLPLTTGPFIGRESELTELSDLLDTPDIHLLSIIAAGGMGKSRLSLELGHLIKDKYKQGAAFIDLNTVRNPDDIAKFAIASLGVSINDTQTAQEVLINYCREKELLLIFDNFEHVLSGATLLTEILQHAPYVSIITTSRERLNLRAETTFYLQPIIEHGDKLFLEIATMMYPKLQLDEHEQETMKYVVELVGGSPLALTIAATWLDTLSVVEIATEIKTNLEFLTAEMGDIPDRQRSIHAVIDPTWNRLNEVEQRAFMWASVFRGGFTRKIFQQVTGASIHVLQTLLNRSLITHGYGRRYDMHPLLRQYAREKLEMKGEFDDAKKVHLEAFLKYAQIHIDQMYDGQHYLEVIEALDKEQDNFRAALNWSLKGNYTHEGIALILILSEFWTIRSQYREVLHYLELANTYREDAAIYQQLGAIQIRVGQLDSANENLQKAIVLATETKRQDIVIKAYRLKSVNLALVDPEEARRFCEEALAISKELNLLREMAHCYIGLGTLSTSIDYLRRAMAIYEDLGDLLGISMAIYDIGIIHKMNGHVQLAKEAYERSLAIKYQIGDRAGAARRLSALASIAIMEEEFEQASENIIESRLICEEIGDLHRLVAVLTREGFLYLITGEYRQAKSVFDKGLKIAIESKYYAYIISFNSYIGLLSLVQGDTQTARPYIMQALRAELKISESPWISLIAYANLLWYDNEFETCLSVTSTLFHHIKQTNQAEISKYFLEPLAYRIRRKFGDDTWQQALDANSETTLTQLHDEIVSKYNFD